MWITTASCDLGKRLSTTQTQMEMKLQELPKTCLKKQLPDMPRITCLLSGWGNLHIHCQSLLSQVFLKDPYYQKMIRDRKMSGSSFFGSAGGWLGLCVGLSAMSVVEIFYHLFLLIVAICKGREMSHEHYEEKKKWRLVFIILAKTYFLSSKILPLFEPHFSNRKHYKWCLTILSKCLWCWS